MANRWSDKEWRSALRLALKEKHETHGTKLRALAEVCVEKGLAGDISAIQEVGNRLDGRPAQDVNIDQRVTHDLTRVSDDELASIIRAGAGGAGSAKTPDDPGKLH